MRRRLYYKRDGEHGRMSLALLVVTTTADGFPTPFTPRLLISLAEFSERIRAVDGFQTVRSAGSSSAAHFSSIFPGRNNGPSANGLLARNISNAEHTRSTNGG